MSTPRRIQEQEAATVPVTSVVLRVTQGLRAVLQGWRAPKRTTTQEDNQATAAADAVTRAIRDGVARAEKGDST